MKTNDIIWALAADTAQARLFAAVTPTAPLELVETLANADAHAREGELHRHQAGHRSGPGARRTTLEPHGSGGEAAAEAFARQVAASIERRRLAGDIKRLYVVAEPAMLGLLRRHLSKDCQRLVSAEIARDPARDDVAGLRAALPERL